MKTKIVCIYLCMLLMIPVLSATVIANEPPTAPDIDGPTSGKAGVPQDYTFTSTDPDGDNVSICIEWGCGESECSDFVPSGEPVLLSHTYTAGTYIIRAQAKDISQAESDWSELEITMPRNRAINMPFLNFLQNHPNMFPLLQMLLQRLGLQ